MGRSDVRHPRTRRPGLLAVVALALVAATAAVGAGCSVSVGGGDLDTADAEKLIVDGYKGEGNVEVTVDCPDEVEPKADATFTCIVTGPSGATADVTVRQIDDEGNIRFRMVPIGLNPGALEAQIAREFQRQRNLTVDVDCPAAIAAATGNVFSCEATNPEGQKARIEVTQKDDSGNVRWRLVDS